MTHPRRNEVRQRSDDPQILSDSDRLSALADTNLVDSPAEYAFDQLTQLACRILKTPVALVSLVTDDRQFFKSSIGLAEEWAQGTPLTHSFCQYVVQSAKPLVVADALADPRLRDNLAVRDLGARAYAGVPLTTSGGHTLGSFCVIDTQPREWTVEEIATLRTLADSLQTEIELRGALRQAQTRVKDVSRLAEDVARQAREAERLAQEAEYQAREAEQARRETAALLEATAEGICGIDADGCCTFVNPAAARMLGCKPGELLGENLHLLIHHHKADGSLYPEEECPIFHTFKTGEVQRAEDDVFFRRDGSTFPVDYCSAPLVEDGATVGAVVSFSNITARKAAEAAIRSALEKERHVAETLQHTILEEVPEDRFPGLSVASRYLAAWQEAQIGGDFYDTFALDGGKVVFVVGDASGKGLSAAIRTAEVKFALRAILHQEPAPALALAMLNDFVCAAQRLQERAEDTFIALTVMVVEAASGDVCVATAGAEPPLVLRADGTAEEVQTTGVPAGFLAEQEYMPRELRLGVGDVILLATDGITEARRGKKFLGYEGMVELAQQAMSGMDSVGAVAQAVLDGAQAFAGGTLHDDACLLLVRRLPC